MSLEYLRRTPIYGVNVNLNHIRDFDPIEVKTCRTRSYIPYYIAHYVTTKFLEIEEGFIPWEHSTDKVRKVIYDYFGIEDSLGLLVPFYEKFEKSNVAGLCRRLCQVAREGEPLCRLAFHEAGVQLGRHVRSCMRQAISEPNKLGSEVRVVCCGNVFHSWDLLRTGFWKVFTEKGNSFSWNGKLNLQWLRATAAYGAARFAARLDAGIIIPCPPDATIDLDQVEVKSTD